MRTRAVAVVFALALLVVTGPAWAAPDIDPSGKPEGFDKGDVVKYAVWKGEGGRWHVAWTTAGKTHTFKGRVTTKGGTIDDAKGHTLEKADWVVIGPKRHNLAFKSTTKGGVDGFSFATDAKKLTFDLEIDGMEIKGRVFVGAKGEKPDAIPFTLSND